MRNFIFVFLGSFLPLLASADCTYTTSGTHIYQNLNVESCTDSNSLCVLATLASGASLKEALGNEACEPNAYATCTYKSNSFFVRMFYPCAVANVENCAPIFNIYTKDLDLLARCQD